MQTKPQPLTAEEERVLAILRRALRLGRADLLFTIRRGRVVQSRLTEQEDWHKEDN